MRVLLRIRDWILIHSAGLNTVSVISERGVFCDGELFTAAVKVCATEQQLASVAKMDGYIVALVRPLVPANHGNVSLTRFTPNLKHKLLKFDNLTCKSFPVVSEKK